MARGLAALLAVALLAGCAPPTGTVSELLPAGRDFLNRLRWQDYQGASAYLPPEYRDEFIERFSATDDLHIIDFKLERAESVAPGAALTWGMLEFYRLPSLTVRKFHFQLEWVYLDAGRLRNGSWSLAAPFPAIP